MKVAIVTNIYTPYRSVQFSLFKEKIDQLRIYFSNEDLQDREWEKEERDYYYILKPLVNFGKYGKLNSGLISIVRHNDLIVLGGYEQPTYIFLSILCLFLKKPYVILFDGISPKRVLKYNKLSFKHLIKKFVIKNASSYFLNGEVSKKYFTRIFGVSEKKIFNQYLSVDKKLFNKDITVSIRDKIRKELEICDNHRVVLYSGRLIKRKNIQLLIDVIANIHSDIILLIIGNGKELQNLKQYSLYKGVQTIFTGNITVDHLYMYYYASDILVLPSNDEPWGLVVNEAIFCNLPVLVSNEVGCGNDLVLIGKNGYIFNIDDKEDFKKKLLRSLELDRRQVKVASENLSKKWNLPNSAESFVSLVESLRSN